MGTACSVCDGVTGESGSNGTTGLSRRDIYLIQLTWKQMVSDGNTKNLSIDFFAQLFETHPYMEKYFEYVGSHMDITNQNFRMSIHGVTVFNRMNSFVNFVDHPAVLLSLMEKLARSHTKKGLTSLDFEKFSEVFIVFLMDGLGKVHMQKEVHDAWRRFFTLLVSVYKMVEREACVMWNFS